jgi:Tol biopolymer transport system component
LGKRINTIYPEYGPIVSADEKILIFTACRPDTKGGKIEVQDGRYKEDIYISYKEEDGLWGVPKPISVNINTEENEAAVALSPDGHKLIIYRHSSSKKSENESGDLYISEFNGIDWSVPQKLDGKINSTFWEPSATITSDERVMIFASNRKGGLGGTDLYIIRKKPDGTWNEPQNLGPKINTKFDEDAPFLHPDGKTLYFSSNGLEGMGEFDIYYTQYDDEKKEWSTPKNLGYPINSARDDLYITWSSDGKRAYFSSMRSDGEGDKDIYVAYFEDYPPTDLLLMMGTIRDSEKHDIIQNFMVTLIDQTTDEIVGLYQTEEKNGKYLIVFQEGIKYKIQISAPGYKTLSENFELTKNAGFKTITKDYFLEKENQ